MADIGFTEPEGATPLNDEEREELIPDHITTRDELNAWEHANIESAEIWVMARKKPSILTVQFVRELHQKMFGHTWKWAGQFRTSDKSIGIAKEHISSGLRDACDDAAYWVENQTYPLPEIAARYHHRLVYVHPFPNGNGRHARLSADVLLMNHNQSRLTWGGHASESVGDARSAYIKALQAADRRNFKPLLAYLGLAQD